MDAVTSLLDDDHIDGFSMVEVFRVDERISEIRRFQAIKNFSLRIIETFWLSSGSSKNQAVL